ncbi:site-2 protease family protein [Candidatus Nanohalococcus occultus]|uniref:site-2 protease family protein n=1 Tax=Candidatus Nanohalococcus occultus TaxID=2978047 RepID=UPI0039E028A1
MIPGLELTPREIFALVFLGALTLFLYLDRKKIERQHILFYRRTERGIELIDSIAQKSKRFWRAYGWAGVGTGILSMIVGTALFGYTIFDMVKTSSVENGPSLLLPGLQSEATIQSGVSFIPIEYWLISIAVLMVVHEMSHGIVARANDFELNSVGWVIMGFIPGAFVEPKGENMLPGDEANRDDTKGMWEQGNWKQRLQVLGAGSFANYLTAGLFILAYIGFMGATTAPSDVAYIAEDGHPAAAAGMNNGTFIQIQGQDIENLDDVGAAAQGIEVNESVTIWSSEGNFTFNAGESPDSEGGHLGVRYGQNTVVKDEYEANKGFIQWMISLLYTVSLLNLLIGLFNMLPFKPLDGGVMLETIAGHFNEDWIDYVNTFSLIGWAVVLGTLALSIGAMVI